MKLKISIYQIIPLYVLNQTLPFLIKLKAMKCQAFFQNILQKISVHSQGESIYLVKNQ